MASFLSRINPFRRPATIEHIGTALQQTGIIAQDLRGRQLRVATQQILEQLKQTATRRKEKDRRTWVKAIEVAENPDKPRWNDLLNIYEQAMWDGHLQSCVNIRTGLVLRRPYYVWDNGKPSKELTVALTKSWFRKACEYILHARQWGYSVFALEEEVSPITGQTNIKVVLIPRKHIRIEKRLLVLNPNDADELGIPLSKFKNIIVVHEPGDYGLLKPCSLAVMSKVNAEMDWDELSTRHGLPFMVYKTIAGMTDELDRRERLMQTAVGGNYAVIPQGEDINGISPAESGQVAMFSDRMKIIDQYVSKMQLGGTLLTDGGQSYSQAAVHKWVNSAFTDSDELMLIDVIYEQVFPLLEGFQNATYGVLRKEELTVTQLMEVVKTLHEVGANYDLSALLDEHGIVMAQAA